jgi:hypothetical protein
MRPRLCNSLALGAHHGCMSRHQGFGGAPPDRGRRRDRGRRGLGWGAVGAVAAVARRAANMVRLSSAHPNQPAGVTSRRCASSAPCTQLLYHCSPHHQDSALHPILGQIIRSAGIERDDTPDNKLDKLEALLEQSREKRSEEMPLYAALLSIPGGDRYQLPKLTPQRMKTRTMSLLLARLKQLAAHQPVLMVFEDVHWIDPTSLELLSLAIDEFKTARILMLAQRPPRIHAALAIASAHVEYDVEPAR